MNKHGGKIPVLRRVAPPILYGSEFLLTKGGWPGTVLYLFIYWVFYLVLSPIVMTGWMAHRWVVDPQARKPLFTLGAIFYGYLYFLAMCFYLIGGRLTLELIRQRMLDHIRGVREKFTTARGA